MWFDSWTDIARILVVGSAAYVWLVLVLRTFGKRTLSQLNAFDFVVTIALGSTLATILLNSAVSWSEGAIALVLLTGLQLVVAWVSAHWPGFKTVITTKPALLLADGQIRHDALKKNRLTESGLREAIRKQGTGDLSQVKAVVLETNGKLSIIPISKYGNGSALEGVRGIERI